MSSRFLSLASLAFGLVVADVVPTPGTQRVAPVFRASDLVCTCRVQSLRTIDERTLQRGGKPVMQRRVVAAVRIDESYKSEMRSGAEVYVLFEEELPPTRPMPTLSSGELGIMFLKLSSPSLYQFSDPFLGVTPFKSVPAQSGRLGLARLQSALTSVLKVNDPEDQVRAMRILEGLDEVKGPDTLAELDRLASSPSPDVAMSSIAVLLKAKAPGSVGRLENYLQTHTMQSTPAAVLSIASELEQAGDSNDLTGIENLTDSEVLSIKLAAIGDIRRIGSQHSGSALIARLDDPNVDIRFLAVITLSEIFSMGGDYAPNMAIFAQNPDFYTAKWKAWWLAKGRSGPTE